MRLTALILSLFLIAPSVKAASVKKYAALTFDDGPHPVYTAKILKILYDNNVTATFFVVGENAERYPQLVKAEHDLGCEIGNHTYSHPHLAKTHIGKIEEEILKTDGIIKDITGMTPKLFRPPEGFCTGQIEKELIKLKKTEVLWNVDTRDWAHTETDKIVKNIKSNVKNGSVILFHDYTSPPTHTVEALEIVVPYLLDSGFELVTVSELMARKADTGGLSSFFIG